MAVKHKRQKQLKIMSQQKIPVRFRLSPQENQIRFQHLRQMLDRPVGTIELRPPRIGRANTIVHCAPAVPFTGNRLSYTSPDP